MELLTKDIRERRLANGRLQRQLQEGGSAEADFIPVVKRFTPDGACTWLLTELDPDDPDIAFALCDLGMCFSELGNVSISELESVRGRLGIPVERDLFFAPTKTLSAFTDEASRNAFIKA